MADAPMPKDAQGGYGLYVHIPFCHSRCHYCDFYSTTTQEGVPEAYVDALLRDFARHAPREAGGTARRPQSVYFGGGTPGLLAPRQVAKLLKAVRPLPGAEVTLEANPESADAAKLAGWRAAGVNRLSVGVQSARDATLRLLGRRHTAAEAKALLAAARAAGFGNVSGDVMLALPGEDDAAFDETLALLVDGGVRHVSAYLLKIEAGTPFGAAPPPGLPNADAAAERYLYAAERLAQAGFARYEISNFAQPGCESRHNLLYWDARDYLGLGPAAHSSLARRRFSFAPSLEAFLADALPPTEEGTLTAEDALMLRLRLEAGVDLGQWHARFGGALAPRQSALLGRLAQSGLARQTPQGWALTGRGMLVQNQVLGALLA
ncbi:MAG: radical SAM family heme chaperone HemW [Oscillospiraceae bacterium]